MNGLIPKEKAHSFLFCRFGPTAEELGILLCAVCLHPAAQLVIPLQQQITLRREHRTAAALSAGGGMKELEAQLLLSGSQHRPGLGVGHVHGERCRPQGMILLDPVQKLRNPRPEYLVIRRIEADGHFEKHVTVHAFIVPVFSEMSMELAIKPHWN